MMQQLPLPTQFSIPNRSSTGGEKAARTGSGSRSGRRCRIPGFVAGLAILALAPVVTAGAEEPPRLTSLSDPNIEFKVPDRSFAILRQGDITAAVVNNDAVDQPPLAEHRAGYSGLGYLGHRRRNENLFVPSYAGLNFEHIHDGTVQERTVLFEPRNAPMELRVVDERTAELYQPATPHWGLESCHRYRLLDDGAIEMVFECIPRKRAYRHGYIGLFWASYMHQPESLDIFFRGRPEGEQGIDWMRGVTPQHGVDATHLAIGDDRSFEHDADFPLSLVFHRSSLRYAEPWYYGVSHGMAYIQMFRPRDQVRLTQSPSGGGRGNPAWDFQYFIADYELGKRYQFVMRTMYVPFESPEQIQRVTAPHRAALGHSPQDSFP